ncbi:MAG: recombinase family protein [Christensenellaceae bacterium]
MTERGIYHNGKPFATNTVYHILKNEKYLGIYNSPSPIQ